MSTMFTEFLNQ